ncbi:MAG: putative MATE family efflux protein [Myxococcota bacterium]|jgi:putative MATE family efflux protein
MSAPISLLEGDVRTVLREQSTPMAVGVVFMILVNLIDTYWAGQLGTDELAAMSFAFPVIGVIINVSLGLMIGTSVAVARVVGAGEIDTARRLATHSLLLGVVIVTMVSGAGLATQDLVFTALGAEPELLPVIGGYMRIWYLGAIFLVVPMMLNGVLRAHGDPKTPRNVMILSAVFNGILDPILIFGLGPIPGMGLEGAAMATAASRAITFVYAGFVAIKMGTLDLHIPTPAAFLASARSILTVGIPATVTNVLGPIATALLTAIVATYGAGAVAAYGIGARVEALVLIAPIALSSGLSPFVGQSWGAHLEKRVAEGFSVAVRFSILWGLGALLFLLPAAPWLARIFSDAPDVQRQIVIYLRIVPIGYAAYSVMMMVSSAFNAMDHAPRATLLSVIRSIVLAVPLAWIGGELIGLPGIFVGLVVASLISAVLGLKWMRAFLDPATTGQVEDSTATPDAAIRLEGADEALREPMRSLIASVSTLPEVELHDIRGDAVGFFVGPRQLGHLHATGHLDLPLPMELGEALIGRGLVEHHRMHDSAGWYTHVFHDTRSLEEAGWLLRLAHVIYAIRLRGTDEQAAEALSELDLDGPCQAALAQAAARWEAA